jgi:hypothetical protein
MVLYNNALSDILLEDCLRGFEENKRLKCWQLSQTSWPQDILVGMTGICAISHVNDSLQERIKAELSVKNELFSIHRTYCQYYLWNSYSGISSHDDPIYAFGATIYLNRQWNIDHGGVFMWDEDGKTTAITPEYNCMMLNNSKQMHRVTAVSPLAPSPRMTMQIWGYNPGQ